MVKQIAAGLMLIMPCLVFAQGQPARPDLNFQQAPLKPTPDWVKLVDHGQFDPRLKGCFAPDGLKIEIVADAPDVINPVGMTFDADGNLYVLEWVEDPKGQSEKVMTEFTYKDGSKRKILIMRKPTKDRVKLLGYNANKGVYDSAKVVLEEELPSSILIHDGWMYLSGQGTVRRYKQQKDGSWGEKQVIAQGFCGYHHHQVSGLTIGNDGWLYITSGDNDNFVEGSDGSRATVLRTGAIFRCRPDGSKLHTYSIGYRNPYRDVAFDAAFNMFHADNDNEDGSKWTGCRLMHIAEGSDFGWRLRPGADCCIPDLTRGAVYGEAPGKLAPMHKTGRGAPAGLLIYNDTYFPEPYRGLLYYPDVFRKVIRAYQVKPEGATFEVTHEFEFLRSNDPLFRPCQMVLGPDGAMYVCDWRTDSGGAGKLWGDGKHGRVYRLTWKGNDTHPAIATRGLDSWARLAKKSDEDLLKALGSDNFSDRLFARHEAVRRSEKLHQALSQLLNDERQPVRARIAALGVIPAEGYSRLNDSSPAMRRLAAEAVGLHSPRGDDDAHDALVRHVNDEDLGVRRAVYLAIGRINNAGAADVIVNGLQFDKGTDDYLRDGLIRALEYTGKAGIAKLLALADSGAESDLARVLEVYPSLRTREAADKLHVLLANYHVKPEQKVTLIRAFLSYQTDPPISVEPLAKFLDQLPKEATKKITEGQLNSMRLAALDVLAAHGKIDSTKLGDTLAGMLKSDDPKSRQAVLKTIAEARLTGAAPVLVKQLEKDAKQLKDESRDFLSIQTIEVLGLLGEKELFAPILPYVESKNPEMRVVALRALGNIDSRAARKIAEQMLADEEVQVQREAVVLLGQSIEGARVAGKRFVDRKLPRVLLPEVSESLRQFASKEHPDVTELLSRAVKGGLLVSNEPAELKRLADLVAKNGDPVRGRKLYLNHKAVACMSCHRLEGVGGNVGPDLTRIWDTLSLDKVMESMLDPSKEIKEGYQTYVVSTKSGRTISGLKVSQSAKEMILRDVTGKEVRIPRDDIDSFITTKSSLMPDDVVRHLSLPEFIDLIAFLRDRKAQEEVRGMLLTAWAIGPFDADLTKDTDLEKNPDPTKPFVTEEKERLAWRQVQADMARKGFDLRGVAGWQKPGSAYLLTYIFSPKEQKAQLHLQSEEKLKLWLAGKAVEVKGEATPITLQQGWNVLLLRMSNLEASGFVQGRITGAEGLRISVQKD